MNKNKNRVIILLFLFIILLPCVVKLVHAQTIEAAPFKLLWNIIEKNFSFIFGLTGSSLEIFVRVCLFVIVASLLWSPAELLFKRKGIVAGVVIPVSLLSVLFIPVGVLFNVFSLYGIFFVMGLYGVVILALFLAYRSINRMFGAGSTVGLFIKIILGTLGLFTGYKFNELLAEQTTAFASTLSDFGFPALIMLAFALFIVGAIIMYIRHKGGIVYREGGFLAGIRDIGSVTPFSKLRKREKEEEIFNKRTVDFIKDFDDNFTYLTHNINNLSALSAEEIKNEENIIRLLREIIDNIFSLKGLFLTYTSLFSIEGTPELEAKKQQIVEKINLSVNKINSILNSLYESFNIFIENLTKESKQIEEEKEKIESIKKEVEAEDINIEQEINKIKEEINEKEKRINEIQKLSEKYPQNSVVYESTLRTLNDDVIKEKRKEQDLKDIKQEIENIGNEIKKIIEILLEMTKSNAEISSRIIDYSPKIKNAADNIKEKKFDESASILNEVINDIEIKKGKRIKIGLLEQYFDEIEKITKSWENIKKQLTYLIQKNT
ncbi:MAG: hypothetical protein QXG86_00515 [Candidatus Woesearchaeota archaeon]